MKFIQIIEDDDVVAKLIGQVDKWIIIICSDLERESKGLFELFVVVQNFKQPLKLDFKKTRVF
ncbi:hypothetical protein Hanom_Chr08g00690821 [Helianthus anomalus]